MTPKKLKMERSKKKEVKGLVRPLTPTDNENFYSIELILYLKAYSVPLYPVRAS